MSDPMSRRSLLGGALAGGVVVATGGLPLAGMPSARAASASDTRLRFMTWNIQSGVALDNPNVVDLPRIAAVIRAESPDIVVLNEVHRDPDGPGSHGDQPAGLAALLAADGYRYMRVGLTESDMAHGGAELAGSTNNNVILSRHPFVGAAEVVKLPNENYEPGGKDRRSLLTSTVNVRGVGEIRVHVTHLSTPGSAVLVEDQKEQVRIVLEQVDSAVPAVLAGDFNIRVTDVTEQAFSQNNLMQSWIAERDLADSWRQVNDSRAGTTQTTSYGRPGYPHEDRRIDYVYTSPWLEAVGGHVSLVDRNASDHLAVVMDLRLVDTNHLTAKSVLAGEAGLDGWAQLSATNKGEVRLSVCKNRGTTQDDGTTVRATLRTPSGRVVRTVVDGGTSRDRATIATWRGHLARPSTLEVSLVRGDTVLHSRVERIG
ncbi:endonuclease/exonuclease/phosphatase family protein [Micromonospora echinospora]|uniref:endonuclease/exonuclease/phosphatase family protein n=1 Tax=Micromonospora echinospora TaxID=1877 RepID=UPI00366F8E77